MGGPALVLVSALALVACDDQPEADEQATASATAGDVQLEPGLYRMQVSIGGGEGAASQFADDNTCLTESDVAGGYREMLLDMQGRDSCRFDSYDLDGDALEAVMVCEGGELQPQTEASITGTVTSTATDLRMSVAGFEEGASGIDMRVSSERIGDCDQAEG